jgi:hypothetical protein
MSAAAGISSLLGDARSLRRIDKTGAVSLRRAGRLHHISIGASIRFNSGKTFVLLSGKPLTAAGVTPLRQQPSDP